MKHKPRQRPTPESGIDRLLRNVQQQIADTGWSVVAITGDPTIPMPVWAYTVGLRQSFQHPELIMCGLPPERAQRLLNDMGFAIKAGRQYTANEIVTDLLANYPAALKAVHPSWFSSLIGVALRLTGDQPVAMLHVIYPDAERRFPWDADCTVAWAQPRLDLPMPEPVTPSA